ncbi:ribonuclease P [Candidatus Bathyarchaeota archaeon]|nr:MAG: ribonuclease P [Candidatus Bathyarchaeota archaeon]
MKSIPLQRIETLYRIALKATVDDPQSARRYISLLRRIAQRTRTKLPPHVKHDICKKCNTPLIRGINATTRIRQSREPHVATTCHTCGNITRRPLRRKNT